METNSSAIALRKFIRIYATILGIALATMLLTWLVFIVFLNTNDYNYVTTSFSKTINYQFLIFTLVGFGAQLIDGALGMAYGVSCTSFLMSAGVSPIAASAAVHVAEVFTAGLSGFSHWKMGNINKKLFKQLAIPGAIGAALGAYVLYMIDGDVIKPYIAIYLLAMGGLVIFKAFRKKMKFKEQKRTQLLALFGGFADASGGGGWGPVVSSTLIGNGNNPRHTIGTVNAVEFFVAMTASGVFTLFIGVNNWQIIAGLIAGGALAAPIGAFVCNRINLRISMVMVGLLIVFLSVRTILKSVGWL